MPLLTLNPIVIHEMEQTIPPNPFDVFKNAYFGLLDQTVELAKQPVESAKKLMAPAIDAQKEMWNSMSREQNLAPMREMASASAGYMEFYSKTLSQGLDVAKKTGETWTDIFLAWQKVALDTQNNAVSAYKSWLNQVKDQVKA